eukprot:4893669-Amphidinium_carterae.1
MNAEEGARVSHDAEQQNHAGGSIQNPGMADECMETEVDRQIGDLLKNAPTFDEWLRQRDVKEVDEMLHDDAENQLEIDAEPHERDKVKSKVKTTVGPQASDPDDAPEWSAWDLKRVTKLLRGPLSLNKIRAVLRRLH